MHSSNQRFSFQHSEVQRLKDSDLASTALGKLRLGAFRGEFIAGFGFSSGIRFKRPFHRSVMPLLPLLIFILAPFALSLVPCAAAHAADVTLAWNKNSEPDMDGYKLYYGTSSRAYNHGQDVGNFTTYTISNLDEGTTYYFAVTAYDSAGNEGDFSEEIVYTIAVNTYSITASAGYHGTVSPSGNMTITEGASQTFSITPDQGYYVSDVLVDNASVGATTSYTFKNVTQNHTIAASFALGNQPPHANAGVDQTVEQGDTVTLSGANSFDPDDQDAFPSDPTESIDTDGDGIGNNADKDDDNDEMPDAWEIQYGLDSLVNDASEDADLDGISNLDEFLAQTDPIVPKGNSAPDAPALIFPSDQEPVTSTPMLQTDVFYDPDPGDVHSETQWQIIRQADNVCVLDVTSPNSLTSLQVPASILKQDARYIWQARFYDSHGVPSEWSEQAEFVTQINPEDSNENGIPDDQEVVATADMNEDGIFDADQDTIKSVKTKGEKSQVGISFEGSDTVSAIEYLAYQDPRSLNSPSKKPKNFPFGLIDFRLLVAEPGDQAVITIYFSDRAPKDGKWYKYDPIEGTWLDYSAYAELGANRKSITLLLQDGGMGDADGIANGIIVDPSGLCVDLSGSSSGDSGGGGGSCFISATAYGSSINPQARFLHELMDPGFPITLLFLILIAGGGSVWIRKLIEKHKIIDGSYTDS